MKKNLDVASPATNDRAEAKTATHQLRKRWKRIKYPLQFLMGTSTASLTWMHLLMYGNWEKWNAQRWNRFGEQTIEGFSGAAILATPAALKKIGGWDERIQTADFDLYLRTKKRSLDFRDIKPIQLIPGIFFHHYGRLTLKSKNYTPFADADNLISSEEKWGKEMDQLLADLGK